MHFLFRPEPKSILNVYDPVGIKRRADSARQFDETAIHSSPENEILYPEQSSERQHFEADSTNKKQWKNKNPNQSNFQEDIIKFSHSLEKSEKNMNDQLQRNREESNKVAKENREELTNSLQKFEINFSNNIKDIKDAINQQFKDIRDDNTKQLDKMRETVDEKLQKTLEKRIVESFKLVSERLEEVHKGLGEMQTIATGVGDLKKVLSNVKTKGVFGEYQLGNILEQILTPDQYGNNVATNPDYNGSVEYAVKMPGKDTDSVLWLPIDSKFPTES